MGYRVSGLDSKRPFDWDLMSKNPSHATVSLVKDQGLFRIQPSRNACVIPKHKSVTEI